MCTCTCAIIVCTEITYFMCIQYERVCTFTDTSWKWHFYGHYDGLHNLWLLTHTRCLQDGSIDYTASNDLWHHCSRLSKLEICPQSENRCCADLSPKLQVSQLVTQPIQPWPSLLTHSPHLQVVLVHCDSWWLVGLMFCVVYCLDFNEVGRP